jgi:hypothetical protein
LCLIARIDLVTNEKQMFVFYDRETLPGDAVQRGADLERVDWAKGRCPLIFCELSPGDAIFFHANLLHTSDQVRLG